jgi:hypothetical protein
VQIRAKVTSARLKGGVLELEMPATPFGHDPRVPMAYNCKITLDGKLLPYVTKAVLVIDVEKKIPILTLSMLVIGPGKENCPP